MTENVSLDLIELFESVVKCKKEDFTIDFEYFDGKGQGFVGDIVFVNLTLNKTKENIKIAVKQQKLNNGKPVAYTVSMFDTEIYFYKDLWPKLHKFYQETTGKSLNVVAKYFGSTSGEIKRIALENLKEQDFKLYDKTTPFNDAHFSYIFNVYGRYHGISMALKEQNIEVFNELIALQNSLWSFAYASDDTYASKLLLNACCTMQKEFDIKTQASLIKKLQLYEKEGSNIVNESIQQGIKHGIILHGDCWSNNFMFKYGNSGEITDIRLLDFQIIFKGSPVFDLSYCFYSAGSEESYNNLDKYQEIYHSSLASTLRDFNLNANEIYPLSQLKEEWKKYSKFGFANGVMLWNIKLADKENLKDFSEYTEEELITVGAHKIADNLKERHTKLIKDLMLHMHERNFL